MPLKIKYITRKELIKQLNKIRIFQQIDGDLVEGIMRPSKDYIYWLGSKRYEFKQNSN